MTQGWWIAVLSMLLSDIYMFITVYYPLQGIVIKLLFFIGNPMMFYNILNIAYNIVFNIFILYRNHKLRLVTFAESHFNSQTLVSF